MKTVMTRALGAITGIAGSLAGYEWIATGSKPAEVIALTCLAGFLVNGWIMLHPGGH